ncbi:MAG: TIGR01777 family oxidoreductase [Candidatus Sericytochromatia bacterium]
MTHFERRLSLPVPADFAYAWHARPGAFERLTPPWEPVRVAARQGSIDDGDWLRMQMGPMPWLARHRGHLPGRQFVDLQAQGPFAYWQHRHLFEEAGENQSTLADLVEYRLPLLPVSAWAEPLIAQRLDRMFAWRHRVTLGELTTHFHYNPRGTQSMKILITGASGLIGSALRTFLSTGGHSVSSLSRRPDPARNVIGWDPAKGQLDASALEGFDAVIHLAGENIAAGRWSEARKRELRESRIQSTRLLVDTLMKLKSPPQVLLSASATGIYGERGDQRLSEASDPGSGFLADLCRDWEAEGRRAETAGIRVVELRTGLVLSASGGVLAQLLLPFQLGLGARLGHGHQFMSWIALDDWLRAALHAVMNPEIQGPLNLVAPAPVTNRVFTQTLARVLGRPAWFLLPTPALELVLGEMADELLLSSQRVEPARLSATGFVFQYPQLEGALRHLLGR